jgi:hypothetical protein
MTGVNGWVLKRASRAGVQFQSLLRGRPKRHVLDSDNIHSLRNVLGVKLPPA